mgnify:CR=1 FL=1
MDNFELHEEAQNLADCNSSYQLARMYLIAARAQGDGEAVAFAISDTPNKVRPLSAFYVHERLADKHIEGYAQEATLYKVPLYTHPPAAKVPGEWRKAVQRVVDELSIMDESEGIAGFHLNGDISPWSEGELPGCRDELENLLSATPQPEAGAGQWVRCKSCGDFAEECDVCGGKSAQESKRLTCSCVYGFDDDGELKTDCPACNQEQEKPQ